MPAEDRTDRRDFIGRGLKGAAGLAAAGVVGGGLLEACATSSTSSTTSTAAHPSSPYGGTVTMGTWSEVNSLSPPVARWDATGYLYANAIYDSLVQIGADGKAYPYLAKSVTPNGDFTAFTITLRPGIMFHDGEKCDAKAVAGSLNAVASGYITHQSLQPIKTITATGPLTVVVKMDQPWPVFPAYLAGQLGYIASPKMLARKDQGTVNPVGTGPFIFQGWSIGQNLKVTRNPHYWQKGLPYLDAMTFLPLEDNQGREDALRSGTVNLIHSQYPGTIKHFTGDPNFKLIETKIPPNGESAIDFIMLNVTKPPLNDPNVRRALALGLNAAELRRVNGFGLVEPATSIFLPGSPYYTPTSYPQFDPAAARKLVNAYKQRHGSAPTVELSTINGASYQLTVELIQQQWTAVGINCSVAHVDFTAFLTNVVLGNYEAATFEQFGVSDPDQNYVWWSSTTVGGPGQVSLNIARNSDSRIEQQLLIGRHSTVHGERLAAYQKVSQYLADDLPFLYLYKTLWAAISKPNVAGITHQTLPGGQQSVGFFEGGLLVHQLRLNG